MSGIKNVFPGYTFADFTLIEKLLPVTDATTPDELQLRARSPAEAAALASFCGRAGRGIVETARRLAALNLRIKDGRLVGDKDRILLPTDAWPVAVDFAALSVFLSRETHRAINPAAVLAALAGKYIAGGRAFGAVTPRVVEECLGGGLPALLCRVKAAHSALPPAAAALLEPLGLSVAPSAADIRSFSQGKKEWLMVSAGKGRHAMEAMASIGKTPLSGLVYRKTYVLENGLARVVYRCERAGNPTVAGAAGAGELVSVGEGEGEGEANCGSDCEGEVGEGEGEGCGEGDGGGGGGVSKGSGGGEGGGGECGSGGGMMGGADGAAGGEGGGGGEKSGSGGWMMGGAGGAAGGQGGGEPLTADIIATAASGLRLARPRQPTRVTKTGCEITLQVYMPPCFISKDDIWLVKLSGVHNHPPDEGARVHHAVEQEVLRGLAAGGTFHHKHAAVRNWFRSLLDTRIEDLRNFIDSDFKTLEFSKVESIDKTAVAASPGGNRGRGARLAVVPPVVRPAASAVGGAGEAPADELSAFFEAAAARLRSGVASTEVVSTLGVPRALFFYDPEKSTNAITDTALEKIVYTSNRYHRENRTVAHEFRASLDNYVKAGWGKLHVVADGDGNATEMHCIIIDPKQREMLYRCASLGDVVSVDDTFGFFRSIPNVNLFAWVAPVAEAGGMAMPIMYMVFLAGSGVERDKSRALSSALDYLHHVRKELWEKRGAALAAAAGAPQSGRAASAPPPPQPRRPPFSRPFVQMSDKDQPTFTALHNSCLALRASAEAVSAVASLRKTLHALAEGASADAIAAGKLLLAGVPGLNDDNSVRSFSIVPPTPADLGAAPLEPEDSAHFFPVFNRVVVLSYGTVLPGLARAVLDAFNAADARFGGSAHSGESNLAAARMLSVLYFFERDSDAADTVQRYYLHFALLCHFHMQQAIRRKLHGRLKDMDLDAVISGIRAVIVDGASWDGFKERFGDRLNDIELKLDSSEGSGRERFFVYFERFWLTARWHTACCGRFRGLLERFGLNTSNDVELLWNSLKNHWLHGQRLGSGAAMLARIIGAPGETAADTAASVALSYSAQRAETVTDAINNPACVNPLAHRLALATATFGVLRGVSAAPAQRFVAGAGGFFLLGADAPGFSFTPRPKELLKGDVRDAKDFANLVFSWGSNARRWNQNEHDKSCGRESAKARATVKAAARKAAARFPPGEFDEHAKLVFQSPPGAEFLALRQPVRTLQEATTAFHPNFAPLILRLEAALTLPGAADPVGGRYITANQGLREGMLSMWATLRRKDFEDARPHVAYIYAVMVTMSAVKWLDEYIRVIQRGERESLLFGDAPLPFGYRVCIYRMQRLARLVSAEKSSTILLTGFYIGQEHKGEDSKTTFDRVDAHGTSDGSPNIKELEYRTRSRQLNMQFGRAEISPHGVVIERRIVALLPGGDKHKAIVNATEALAFVACARLGPAFAFLNDSPPGEQQRLLAHSYAGPPRIVDMAATLITELGGEAKACQLRLREVGAVKLGVFLRDCLEAVHALLAHGNYAGGAAVADADAGAGREALASDFIGGAGGEHSAYSVLTLVTTLIGDMVEMEGDAGGPPRRMRTVVPWCNACDCSRVMAICPHLLAVRILICVSKAPRTWHGDGEVTYWSSATPPSYKPLRLAAAVEGAGLDARAAAAAAEGLPAKVAMVAHQAALIMSRLDADPLNSDMSAALLSVDKQLSSVLRSLEGISRRGDFLAAPRARGRTAAAFPQRARTADEVASARTRSVAIPVNLSPAQLLEKLAANYPLPDQPQLPPYLMQVPASVMRGNAALAALAAAAPRVASAFREAPTRRVREGGGESGGEGEGEGEGTMARGGGGMEEVKEEEEEK